MKLGDGNYITVNEGEGEVIRPLKTASARQSGVKIKYDFEIPATGNYALTLDFDASRFIEIERDRHCHHKEEKL